MIKFLLYTIIVMGFLMLFGTAGSDCDGKCLENAMSITDALIYGISGTIMIAIGGLGLSIEK